MSKKFYVSILSLFFIISCKKDSKDNNSNNNSYVLTINIDNQTNKLAVIQNLNNPTFKDSARINNNIAVFNGKIDYPERYILTIENMFGGKMFILENDSINISITNNDLINAQVTNSIINNELLQVQKSSEDIYNKIDLLFPDLQRARLENDAEKLSEISKKMSLIEKENIDFNFSYATNNPTSFISAMILYDLSKRDSIDVNRIKSTYDKLSDIVKKNSDALKVNQFLEQLH